MHKYAFRMIASAIALFLVILVIPLHHVNATSSDFSYILLDGEITITGGGLAVDRTLIVPDTINGYPVCQIGAEAFANVTSFERVVIPEGIRCIGKGAFMSCKNLNKIIISSTVTNIGENAFAYCTYLHSIRFEGNPPQIETNAFYGVIGTICTPGGSGWPEQAYRQSYGGSITWRGGHAFGSYAYGVGATCTEDGVIQQECVICGKLKQQPHNGSKLGHRFEEYISDGNATCISDGTKTAKCVRCDVTDTVVDVGSMEHKDSNKDCLCDFCFDIIDHACIDEDNNYHCDWCYQEYCSEGAYFPGDISGDGNVNMGDVSKLYAHIKGTGVITDENAICRCDVTGDGNVNMGDVSKLYAHIRGTSKLY